MLASIGEIIHPFAFLGLLALGAAGVALALPRRGTTPQVLGAIVAGLAGGLALLFMGLKAGPDKLPNIYFYIFALLGLGAALRVITHPRPVYAALYFILSVIATAGLFLLLSAEFMAFALIIVYAGAILITYLFVIMLATQSAEEGQEDVLAEYDTAAREPIFATVAGFLLLGVLTVMLFRGATDLAPPQAQSADALLSDMPRKVERVLKNHMVVGEDGELRPMLEREWTVDSAVVAQDALRLTLIQGDPANPTIDRRTIPKSQWPSELRVSNVEALGFNFLREHPGTIEIAGVILLMAMLGAVVLSRKQVQIDEDAKAARVTQLAQAVEARDVVRDAPFEPVQQPELGGGGGGGGGGGPSSTGGRA